MLKLTLLAVATLTLSTATAHADVMIVDNNQKLAVDCAKDKAVHITGNKAEVTLKGTCDEVNISGNKATIKGSVLRANISGNENTLALEAVDQILVTGNKNTVTYKQSAKAKQTGAANTGSDNKISQTK